MRLIILVIILAINITTYSQSIKGRITEIIELKPANKAMVVNKIFKNGNYYFYSKASKVDFVMPPLYKLSKHSYKKSLKKEIDISIDSLLYSSDNMMLDYYYAYNDKCKPIPFVFYKPEFVDDIHRDFYYFINENTYCRVEFDYEEKVYIRDYLSSVIIKDYKPYKK